MALSREQKHTLIQKFGQGPADTGSVEVQVALLTGRIQELTEHLQVHRKDFHSRRGLHMLVGRRRRLLQYLRRTNPRKYQQLLQELNIRGV